MQGFILRVHTYHNDPVQVTSSILLRSRYSHDEPFKPEDIVNDLMLGEPFDGLLDGIEARLNCKIAFRDDVLDDNVGVIELDVFEPTYATAAEAKLDLDDIAARASEWVRGTLQPDANRYQS
jgi:hypothetical protein